MSELAKGLREGGGELIVRHGRAEDENSSPAHALRVAAVYANRDYEPAAKARDSDVANRLAESGITFALRKDQAMFDGDEVLTGDGRPFSVFTPYKNAWLKKLQTNETFYVKPSPIQCRAMPAVSHLPWDRGRPARRQHRLLRRRSFTL